MDGGCCSARLSPAQPGSALPCPVLHFIAIVNADVCSIKLRQTLLLLLLLLRLFLVTLTCKKGLVVVGGCGGGCIRRGMRVKLAKDFPRQFHLAEQQLSDGNEIPLLSFSCCCRRCPTCILIPLKVSHPWGKQSWLTDWLLRLMSQDIIRHYRLNKPRDIINRQPSNKVYNFFAFVSLGYYYYYYDFMLIAITLCWLLLFSLANEKTFTNCQSSFSLNSLNSMLACMFHIHSVAVGISLNAFYIWHFNIFFEIF